MKNVACAAINEGTDSPKKTIEKELFKKYAETKDKDIRNDLVNRYLYIAEILSKKLIQIK